MIYRMLPEDNDHKYGVEIVPSSGFVGPNHSSNEVWRCRVRAGSYRHVYLGHPLTLDRGQVDQLEDRYLGMVEASGSNPDLSIIMHFIIMPRFWISPLLKQFLSR